MIYHQVNYNCVHDSSFFIFCLAINGFTYVWLNQSHATILFARVGGNEVQHNRAKRPGEGNMGKTPRRCFVPATMQRKNIARITTGVCIRDVIFIGKLSIRDYFSCLFLYIALSNHQQLKTGLKFTNSY